MQSINRVKNEQESPKERGSAQLPICTEATEKEQDRDCQQAQEALRESEKRFRLAFNDAEVGMALVSPKGRFLQVNRSLCEIVGYIEAQLQATDFQLITHPDDLDVEIDYIRQLLAGEIRTYQMEKRFIHKYGHIVWIGLSVSLVRDRQGLPLYFMAQIQDISERKRTQAEIAASLLEKEALFKEIHNRIKNNLQVICRLLNWQLQSLEVPSLIERFKEAQNRIRSMALIHEKLYQSENLFKINLAEYIGNLANDLLYYSVSDRSKINLTINICPELVLDIDTIISCGLIVNELISKAIEYNFKPGEKGEISIQIKFDKHKNLVLIIADNNKIFPIEFDLEKIKNLGFKLVGNFTQLRQRTIQLETYSGTKFIVTLTQIKSH